MNHQLTPTEKAENDKIVLKGLTKAAIAKGYSKAEANRLAKTIMRMKENGQYAEAYHQYIVKLIG